ncbi:hypothetical protein ACJZ2D_011136 [Fusarium nematophilum]
MSENSTMFGNVDWDRTLDLISLLGVTHYAGYHYCSDKLAVHNLLRLNDRNAAIQGWFRAWNFGRRFGPASVIIPGTGFALAAWRGIQSIEKPFPECDLADLARKAGPQNPSFAFKAAASALLLSVAVYTHFSVFPINDKLLAEHERIGKAEKSRDGDIAGTPSFETVRRWLRDWKHGDAIRMILTRLAVLAGAIAVLKA